MTVAAVFAFFNVTAVPRKFVKFAEIPVTAGTAVSGPAFFLLEALSFKWHYRCAIVGAAPVSSKLFCIDVALFGSAQLCYCHRWTGDMGEPFCNCLIHIIQ